jgi:hypothetical protein
MSNQELQTTVDTKEKIAKWRTDISTAWSKSIESIVKVATLLKEADEDIANEEDFEKLKDSLPFSAPVASNLRKIADHEALTNPENFGKLPGYINTLYYLAFVPSEHLVKLIEQKKVDAYTKLAQAKAYAFEYGLKPDESKTQTRFENMVEVGVIAIPKDAEIGKFIADLDKLLETYNAATRYTHKEGSLAEKYLDDVKKEAQQKIDETQGELGQYTLDDVRLLDEASSYLSVRNNPKTKVSISNTTDKEAGLPETHEHYQALHDLLGTEVTNAKIREWCNNQKVPCQLMVSSLDKEVYVWYLLQAYTTSKEAYKELRLLEKISKGKNISDRVKNAAVEALNIAQKFDNPRKPKTESAPRKKRTPRKKEA